MKKIFLLLFFSLILFGFDLKEAKQILDKNDSKEILQTINSKDGFNFLALAIKENRLDIVKFAIKNHFDFSTTNEDGATLLDFSTFFLNKKAVKLLSPIINPNHLSKKGLNSLRFLLRGLSQEYRWLYNSKEKLTKILKDDKLSKSKIKDTLKLYGYLRKSVFEIIDILKQNGARFEIAGAYPNEITFLISARKGRVDSKFKYKLIEKILDDKGKLFFYIGMDEFKKAKKFIDTHPNILKEPFFLDYPSHFFQVLQKDEKYCDIVKYMIEKNKDIIYYQVTAKRAGFLNKRKRNCFKKLYAKYNLKNNNWDNVALDKKDEVKQMQKEMDKVFGIFKAIKNQDYKTIERLTKQNGWNIVANKMDVLEYTGYNHEILDSYTTPFLEALLGKYANKKIADIMLKNGAYMSGWNELHYDILNNKPLNLDKYQKWDRVFKLNQGDLLINITPLYLAVLKNDLNLVKKLINYGADIDTKLSNDTDIIEFAIIYNKDENIIKYLINQKKSINESYLILLTSHKYFNLLEYIKQNKISNKYNSLEQLVLKVKDKLQNNLKRLSSSRAKVYEKEIVKPFNKVFEDVVNYDKMLVEAIDKNDTKKALLAINNNANINQDPAFFGKSATLLMIATLQDNKKIVKALLKKGADVLFKNKHGNSFLHVAAQNDILPIALKTKAKKYIIDPVNLIIFKAYPLTIALFNKRYNNVKLLLKHGAKLPNKLKKQVYCYMKRKKLDNLIYEFKKYKYSFENIKCDK